MDGRIFEGVITFLVCSGIAIGFVLFVVIPWLWQYVKPFIHAITS